MWSAAILASGYDLRRYLQKMIEYLENFLGLDNGFLSNSDFGIVISLVLTAVLVFAVFKALFLWFDKLFGRTR